MGNRVKNRFLEVMSELDHFFVMATGTEPPSTAAERQDELMMAVWAFNASESLMQITTFKIIRNHMRDYRPVKSILHLEKFIVALFKIYKMTIQKLPERSRLSITPVLRIN